MLAILVSVPVLSSFAKRSVHDRRDEAAEEQSRAEAGGRIQRVVRADVDASEHDQRW